MRVIRFIGYLILPWLAPLLLIPLAILWIIGSIVVYIWTTWEKTKKRFEWQI